MTLAADQPTAHTAAATAWNPAPSMVEQMNQGSQEPAAEQPPLPTDKWGQIEFFAKRACAPIEIESEMALMFEKRKLLGRRLMDAAKRRDDDQARESAQSWIQTEIKLAQLFVQYTPFVQERKSVLASLGMGGQ